MAQCGHVVEEAEACDLLGGPPDIDVLRVSVARPAGCVDPEPSLDQLGAEIVPLLSVPPRAMDEKYILLSHRVIPLRELAVSLKLPTTPAWILDISRHHSQDAHVASFVRAGALQGFDGLVRNLGGEPLDLRRRHGLDQPEALRDPEAMVSLESVARLLDDAADECARPDLGLRLGTLQNPRMLGLLALVIQGSDSVQSALVDVARYLFVHSPGYQVVVETPPPAPQTEWVTVRFDVDLDAQVPFRQLIDGCLSSLLTLARSLTGIPIVPLSISVPHTPAASRGTYDAVFGAPVAFGQPKAALHVAPDLLTTKLNAARPEIRRTAIVYIGERYPPSTATTATRVRNALGGTIGATRGTKNEIADLLQLHPRTLQRRLNAEGVTFESIREDVYRTATWRLLTLSTMPLSQVAHALGFSEQSAMNRNIRRWFDTTPTEIRNTPSQPGAKLAKRYGG